MLYRGAVSYYILHCITQMLLNCQKRRGTINNIIAYSTRLINFNRQRRPGKNTRYAVHKCYWIADSAVLLFPHAQLSSAVNTVPEAP